MNSRKWNLKTEFPYAKTLKADPTALGEKSTTCCINTFTEFDPLVCTMMGYVDDTALLTPDIFQGSTNSSEGNQLTPKSYPPFMIERSKEFQREYAEKLQSKDIQVLRVAKCDWTKKHKIGDLETTGFHCFNVRDIPFIYGDSLYEFPTFAPSRMREYKCFEWIEEQLTENGSKCYSSWDLPLNSITEKKDFRGTEPFMEAANLLKCGLDILFLISEGGSWGGYLNFRSLMREKYDGKVRVHPLKNIYDGVHIDATFSILGFNQKVNKFLVVACGKLSNKQNMPALFRGSNWAVIEYKDFHLNEADENYSICSNRLGLNVLSLGPNTVCMDSREKTLIKILEFYGIEVIPLENTYGRELGGGFHCQTNDIARRDTYGFKKVLETDRSQLSKEQLTGLFDEKLLSFLQSEGQIEDWEKICNRNGIYPTYLTDHVPFVEDANEIQKL